MNIDQEKELSSIYHDYRESLLVLMRDVAIINDSLRKENNQFWRRTYFRTTFSVYESILSNLKAEIRAIRKFDYLGLSKKEEKKLNEFYDVSDKKGKMKRRFYRLSFLQNVVFTLELYAYSNYVFSKVKTQSKGWKALERSLCVRNRITHPKTLLDLQVSESELAEAIKSFEWFVKIIIQLHSQSTRSLSKLTKAYQSMVLNMKQTKLYESNA
jgi:hypothetical protein